MTAFFARLDGPVVDLVSYVRDTLLRPEWFFRQWHPLHCRYTAHDQLTIRANHFGPVEAVPAGCTLAFLGERRELLPVIYSFNDTRLHSAAGEQLVVGVA